MQANSARVNIEQEIRILQKIQLKEKDYLGEGANAKVYKYSLLNQPLAVKCYK